MKEIIRFSKFFVPAMVISIMILVLGVAGFFITDGFNLGVDFQAGLIQEVQFAPSALRMTYNGGGNAQISVGRNNLTIVVSGIGINEIQYDFPFSNYQTMGELVPGLSAINGLNVTNLAPNNASTSWLIQSSIAERQLGTTPYILHYLAPGARPVAIEEVRSSLLPLGTISVQILGNPEDRLFMIRMDDKEIGSDRSGVPAERRIINTLENSFGQGEVVIIRSDKVDERFSKNLTDQAGYLIFFTLALILVYMTFRFKLQYAVGAVVGIMNDGIVMITFILLTQMEFNITTIAALLTILGYSTNNTIVVFDRIRENRRIFPDDTFISILDRSLTGTLGRTIITTVTTMVAVLSLYIFTTGSMQAFALALLVGMTSGLYTTMFIASGIVYFWEMKKQKKEKKRLESGSSARAPKLAKT